MTCERIEVNCTDCDEQVERGYLDTHLRSECTERQVRCVHAPHGCKWRGKFWKREQHLRFSCRIEPAFPAIQRLQMENLRLHRQLKQLQREIGKNAENKKQRTVSHNARAWYQRRVES